MEPRAFPLLPAVLGVLAGLAPTSALPAQAQPAPVTSYVMADGRSLRAQVLELLDDGQTVRLRILVEPTGELRALLPLGEFSALSSYRALRDGLPADDVEVALRLAEHCVSAGLVTPARRELRRAAELARTAELPDEQVARLVDRGLETVRDLLELVLDAGDEREADEILARLAAVDSVPIPPQRAAELRALVERRVAEAAALRCDQDALREAKAIAAWRDGVLAPLRDRVERATALRHRALLASQSFGTAHRELGRAVDELQRALDRSAGLRELRRNDDVLATALDDLDSTALATRDDCLLAMASLDLTRGNHNRAMAEVNRILADTPEQSRALAMRARIELAANRDGQGVLIR
ncbi:MAG: hypothetical protein IPM29_29055 [Planctomycetes bacterium]|nr:hypothetical protein [Planctomycetota bacterium]